MLRADLDWGGGSEAERDDRFIKGTMSKLALSSISLKGTKLPVRPPVLVMGERSEEKRGIGGEGTSSVFRGNN